MTNERLKIYYCILAPMGENPDYYILAPMENILLYTSSDGKYIIVY